MHKLYDLREMLCRELEEYGDRDSLDMSSLEIVDKLAHAIKNIDKIVDSKSDNEYSGGRAYMDGRAYARGRGQKRDTMGRYSRTEDMGATFRDLMESAPDEQTRMELQRMMRKFE